MQASIPVLTLKCPKISAVMLFKKGGGGAILFLDIRNEL